MYSAQDTLAGGLPHSEIPGSTIARISPGLFAACHVLHRLSVPRHPPNALIALDPKLSKRHAQRQVPAPFAQYFGHSALSALPTADMCDDHEHRRLRRRRQQVPWRRERPRLRPATLSYPRCQRSRRTCDRCRATPGPSIVSSQYRQTLRTPSCSGRPSLVELTGFEPATPCLQSRCSPN